MHDTRAARIWRLAERIQSTRLFGLADKGYVSLAPGVVLCPFEGRGKPRWKKDANSAHATLRTPGKRAIAQLKNRYVLRRLRYCPHRVSELVRAVLVLGIAVGG